MNVIFKFHLVLKNKLPWIFWFSITVDSLLSDLTVFSFRFIASFPVLLWPWTSRLNEIIKWSVNFSISFLDRMPPLIRSVNYWFSMINSSEIESKEPDVSRVDRQAPNTNRQRVILGYAQEKKVKSRWKLQNLKSKKQVFIDKHEFDINSSPAKPVFDEWKSTIRST